MVIREIPVADYSDFIQHHPGRTVFHRVAWLEAAARVYGSTLRYLGLFAGDVLHGVCPVFVLRKFSFQLYGCPLPGHATPRLLPLIPDDKREEALAAFDGWVKENRIRHFQLCWGDTGAQLPKGTRAEILKNLEIPLGSTVDAAWKQVKPRERTKSEAQHVVMASGSTGFVMTHFLPNTSDSCSRPTLSVKGSRPTFPWNCTVSS